MRLDNASNIFLAARSSVDPKVFRISAEMDHSVDPRRLQQALDETYHRYPLYRAVLRRGVFWYYLQDSDLRPIVTPEDQHTCAPIYRPDRRNLLFRVMHHRHRIILELLHVLSDGIGALWFLSDLVTAYVRLQLKQPDECRDDIAMTEPIPDHGRSHAPGRGVDSAKPAHGLISDSFVHYFRRRRPPRVPTSDPEFSRAAVPAVLTVENTAQSSRTAPSNSGRPAARRGPRCTGCGAPALRPAHSRCRTHRTHRLSAHPRARREGGAHDVSDRVVLRSHPQVLASTLASPEPWRRRCL